jgi:hypothetical protein
MQQVDRIEKRRFVGREFLLWLWFESETFDATLTTRAHGSIGLWLEKRLVLSEGKASTRIIGQLPGHGREAKEAILSGQLPDSAGIRIAWRNDETSFVLKAEQLAVSALKLQTVLDQEKEEAPSALIAELKGASARHGRNTSRKPKPEDDAHEVFYERMQLTQEFEGVIEALYQDFLALRLSEVWNASIVPVMRSWVRGEAVDGDAYVALKKPRAKNAAQRAQADSAAMS